MMIIGSEAVIHLSSNQAMVLNARLITETVEQTTIIDLNSVPRSRKALCRFPRDENQPR
jgi:hypothetical protein